VPNIPLIRTVWFSDLRKVLVAEVGEVPKVWISVEAGHPDFFSALVGNLERRKQ